MAISGFSHLVLAGGLFFESTPKVYYIFIEYKGLNTRTLPLAASNECNDSTPASPKAATPTKQTHNMKEPVLSYTTKPRLD
jgi:hypothetical protein